MISFSIVKNLMTSLKTVTGITIARGNQMFKKPSYPYAVYNLLSSNEEPFASNITENGIGSAGMVLITRNQYSEDILSFTVISKTYDEARDKAQVLFNAFKAETIHDFLLANKCSAVLSLTAIQDRTTLLEADYEYRFGFDIVLKSQTAYTEEIEEVLTVEVTQEIYNEAEVLHTENIIVTR